MAIATAPWRLACPTCREALADVSGALHCAGCSRYFPCEAGIWRLIDEARLEQYNRFLAEYQTVRRQEGWGSDRAEYYRSLPRVAGDDPQREIWRRRERSLRTLLTRVVAPAAHIHGRALTIVDAGAGNCWLSHQLSRLGHQVLAVDVSADSTDGLGSFHRYATTPGWTVLQAEFDRLPLAPAQADLLVFNASLHYSASYGVTVQEALRVLRPDGALVVMDSPLYHDAASGAAMVAEREDAFLQTYGFRSNALPSEHFITDARLRVLAEALDLRWQFFATGPALRSLVRRSLHRVRSRREPARMPLIVGTRPWASAG